MTVATKVARITQPHVIAEDNTDKKSIGPDCWECKETASNTVTVTRTGDRPPKRFDESGNGRPSITN